VQSSPAFGNHPDGARRYLIAAGTATYRHLPPNDHLPSVRTDLATINALFQRLWTKPVLDDGCDPTAHDLLGTLERWLHGHAEADGVDVLVVYYSGHGASGPDGSHYLCTADTRFDQLVSTSIGTEQLAKILVGKRVKHLLILIDACWAEQGAHDIVRQLLRAAREGHEVAGYDDDESVWVVAAARRTQEAEEGVFAEALVAAIDDERHGGAKQPYLSVGSLLGAINEDLRRQGRKQRVAGDAMRVTGPSRALPNPRYAPGLPDGISVAEQRKLLADHEHWDPKGRGVATEADAGWYFTGRKRVLDELAAWLKADADDRRLRIVTGGPGSGKSAVLSRLIAISDPVLRHRMPLDVLAEGPDLPKRTINLAVLAKGKTLDTIVEEIGQVADLATRNPEMLLDSLARRGGSLHLVVDALDEATEPFEIADLLAQLPEASGRTRLRIIVGTRSHLLPALGGGTVVLNLDGPMYLEHQDISHYVERYLLGEPNSPYRSDLDSARKAAQAISVKAGQTFLIARVYARMFATAPAPVDITATSWHERPTEIGAVLEEDLARLGPATGWARDLLRPLAYAEGAGLPWDDLWPTLASSLANRPYTDSDIRRLLTLAGAYVVEAVEDDRSVYRLYHQAFADHLRAPAHETGAQQRITKTLVALVARRSESDHHPDWPKAHSYIRTHLATHAAAAGLLDKLVLDPLSVIQNGF